LLEFLKLLFRIFKMVVPCPILLVFALSFIECRTLSCSQYLHYFQNRTEYLGFHEMFCSRT
jgi:hypothetical protein